MLNLKKALVVSAVSMVSLAGLVGSQVTAFAQDASDATADKTHLTKRYHDHTRPLTVRRAVKPAAPVVAPVAAVVNPVTGAASTVVGLPFQALGAVFPAGGPRSGGVTPVRYVGVGPETAKIDEGFAQPVPVASNGPIYVVANGDPTINPMSIIGAPIAVAGQIAQTPFKIIGATGL